MPRLQHVHNDTRNYFRCRITALNVEMKAISFYQRIPQQHSTLTQQHEITAYIFGVLSRKLYFMPKRVINNWSSLTLKQFQSKTTRN